MWGGLWACDLNREDVFVTTKLTNSMQGYDKNMAAFDASMAKLGIDVLELFLIHWPQPMFDQYADTWRAFGSCRPTAASTRSGCPTSRSSTSSACSPRPTSCLR